MAQNKGRMTFNWNDPEVKRLWDVGKGMFFSPGSAEVPSAPVPFMMNSVDDGFRNALSSGNFTPQQWATMVNKFNQQSNAAVNPDGTVSLDNMTYDDEFDFGGQVLMPALAAGVGALSGGFGIPELFNGASAGSSVSGTIPGGADRMTDLWQAAQGGTGGSVDMSGFLNNNPLFGEAAPNLIGEYGNLPSAVTDFTSLAPTQNLGAGALFNGAFTGGDAVGGILESISKLPSAALKALGLANSDGSIKGESLAGLLGKLGAAGLGAYGSNEQAKSLQELAQKYSDYGAPSRARFEAGMTPGFDPMSIPGYKGALDTASKGLLARLSATGGNPFGQPGGLIEANKAIVSGTAMPAINEYLRQNANAGFGSSMNAAIPFETGAIGQQGNLYNSIGYGLNAVTNPQPTLADIAKALSGYDLKYSL